MMNEEEIFKLWDGQTSISKEFPANSEVEKMLRQKSTDVFKKIKINIIIEFIITIPLSFISIPVLFSREKEILWIFIAIASLALSAGIIIYGKYLNDFKKLNQLNIVESLEKKIAILKMHHLSFTQKIALTALTIGCAKMQIRIILHIT
jgi:hypothetical protein